MDSPIFVTVSTSAQGQARVLEASGSNDSKVVLEDFGVEYDPEQHLD